MALLAQKTSVAGLSSRAGGRVCSSAPCLPPRARGRVVLRAANSDQGFDSAELNKKLEETLKSTTATLQKKWEENDEKPATVAISVAALLALVTVSSVVDTIDRIPIISNVIELIGIGVTGWFIYRYLVFGPDREELYNNIKAFINKMYK